MMQKTWMVLAVAAALSACGGGGGAGGVTSGSSSTGSNGSGSAATAAALSGKVVDGYLQGAEVCLDTNADKVCDTAKAITDANGSYSLTHTLTADQLASAHVLVVVPETAKDADDGGKTLKEAGKAAFELLAPAAKPQVVSPLTTLVSERMISNRQSVADAESSVVGTLKLDNGTALLGASADFVAANKADLKQLAQTTAVLLGEVKKVVTNTVSSNAGIVKPAEQQRIEVDAVRDMLRKIVESNQLAQLGTGNKIDPKKVQDLLGSTLATDAANLKDSAQLAKKVTELTPPPATFNISQLLGLPLFNVEISDWQANVCTDSMSSSLLTNVCFVSYKVNGAWQPWKREENGMELTMQGVVSTNTETPYKLSPDTATTFQMQDYVPKLHSATYTLRSQGPRAPSAVFKGVSFAESDVAYPMSKTTNPGTQAYEYNFNANHPRFCGGSVAGVIDCPSFSQLREYYRGGSHTIQFSSNPIVTADFDGEKLALYERQTVNNMLRDAKLAVTGSWAERKVAGMDVMDLTIPDELKAKAGLEAGQQPFFIVYQGKVYQGNRRDIKKYEWTWLNASAFEKVRQFYKLPVLVK